MPVTAKKNKTIFGTTVFFADNMVYYYSKKGLLLIRLITEES